MKKYVGLLMLTLSCSALLQAESVWTGNALVGSPQQFPGSREYFRAASNAFPLGTILKVTNPNGRASVEVIVVERLGSPGVFLLMEMSAAKRIGIPLNHVRPVQVSPIGSSDIGNYASASSGESVHKEDFNTAEMLPSTQMSEDIDEEAGSFLDEDPIAAVPSELEMVDDLGGYNTAGEIMNPTEYIYEKTEGAPLVLNHEIPDMEGVMEDIPDETVNLISAEEPGSNTENLVEHESQRLFLSPSDFRPPTGAAVIPMEQTPLIEHGGDFKIAEYKRGDMGKYIQVGAYQDREVFEAKVDDIQQSNPDYPLRVAITSSSGRTVYKLLVGPIKPAEIGLVLNAVTRNNFPDAFQFTR